jgi:WS/DGAT/MGAT family acyltransferase
LHELVGTEVGVKRLNGMDAMLLYSETPNLHTHTLKVAIVDPSGGDGEFSFDAFRHHLRRRLHLLEPLRYKLVDIPWRLHHPMWLENCDVDLDYHLHRVQVPAPGGRRELDTVIGEVASTPLDRGRPLWEFHVAEGLSGGRFALIGKIHTTHWPTASPRSICWPAQWTSRTHRPMSRTTTRPASRRRPRPCCAPPAATTSAKSLSSRG